MSLNQSFSLVHMSHFEVHDASTARRQTESHTTPQQAGTHQGRIYRICSAVPLFKVDCLGQVNQQN
jgi:hypothetical protein